MLLIVSDAQTSRRGVSFSRLLRGQEVGSSNLPAPTKPKYFIRLTALVNLFLYVLVLLLGLSATPAQAGTDAFYMVVPGDNLTYIAKRFGITLKELRRANNLTSDMLSIDQKLIVPHPFKRLRKTKFRWQRPCQKDGRILRPFGQYKAKNILMARTGEDRICPVGSPVHAPALAVVKHIGELDGFGTVIILQHEGSYATVFSPLNPETIAVGEGQAVNAGQLLGRTDQPVLEESRPYIHIELRKNEIAIDPKPLRP